MRVLDAASLFNRLKSAGVNPLGYEEEEDVSDGSVDLNEKWSVQIAPYMEAPYILNYWTDDGEAIGTAGSYTSVEKLVAAIKEKVHGKAN